MGLLLGAWNGWWVAYRKVPSFIVTLAGMLAFRGILIGITNGTTVSPTSPAMSQIGQSYLPDGIGFGIGVVGMAVFIVWQWRGRMRRQALGLATSSSTAAVGRQAITAVIVLGAIWLLNDYRGVPTPVLILAALLLAGLLWLTWLLVRELRLRQRAELIRQDSQSVFNYENPVYGKEVAGTTVSASDSNQTVACVMGRGNEFVGPVNLKACS